MKVSAEQGPRGDYSPTPKVLLLLLPYPTPTPTPTTYGLRPTVTRASRRGWWQGLVARAGRKDWSQGLESTAKRLLPTDY